MLRSREHRAEGGIALARSRSGATDRTPISASASVAMRAADIARREPSWSRRPDHHAAFRRGCSGARARHLEDGRGPAPARRRDRGAAARPRSRHDARSTPPRCMLSGGAEEVVARGDRAAAATRSSWSARCCRPMRRAQGSSGPASSLKRLRHRPASSFTAALARRRAARRNGCRLRDAEEAGQDPALGREQFRYRRHGGTRPRAGGADVQTNQVLYNLSSRGIEYDLLPRGEAAACRSWPIRRVGQGDLTDDAIGWDGLPTRHGATPAQVALAWVLRRPGVIAIPKAAGRTMCATTVRRSTFA